MTLRTYFGLGILVSLATCSSVTFAQEPAEDILAGPSVQDEEVTQEDMRAEQLRVTGKGNRNQQSRQQDRVWMKTLQSLDLSKEQQTEIQSLVHQLQKAKEEFQKTYGAELTKIRKEQRKANNAAFAAQAAKESENANVLMKLAPKPEEYQAKVWILLTENQQHSFQQKYQAELEKLEKSLEKRKGNHDPMMDEMDEPKKGSGSKNFPFRDRNRPQKDERQFDRNNQDDVSLRRARFLRRLQKLQNDS